MKSIALICDPHLHEHPLFGHPYTHTMEAHVCVNVCNNRLTAGRKALKWAINCANHKKDCCAIVIMGDLTHKHGVLTPPVVQAIRRTFDETHKPIFLIPGNHDMDSNGISCLDAFADGEEVKVLNNYARLGYTFTREARLGWKGIPVSTIKYGSNELFWSAVRSSFEAYDESVLLAHHHFDGAVHGSHEFAAPSTLDPQKIPDTVKVISGHFHKRQQVGKVFYPGALLQHNFGETDYVPGMSFLHEDGTMSFEENTESPRFHIVEYTGDPDMELPGEVAVDYYRFDYVGDTPSGLNDVRARCTYSTSKQIHAGDAEVRTRISKVLAEDKEIKHEDALTAYTVMNESDTSRQERLLALGKELSNG